MLSSGNSSLLHELFVNALPLLGAGAIGGGLIVNEINRRIAIASEQRKSLGMILTDLLDIRYYLIGAKAIKQELRRVTGGKNTATGRCSCPSNNAAISSI